MLKKLLTLLFFIAVIHSYAQDPKKMIDTLKAELSRPITPERKAAVYSDLTWYYANVSIDSALTYGKKALSLARAQHNEKLTAQVYSDLGAVYLNKGAIDDSYENYLACLKIRRKLKDASGVAGTMSNLGVIYERIGQRDSAMANYTKALTYFESVRDHKKVDMLKNNIGLLYENMENYPQAEKLYKEVAAYRRSAGQKIPLAMVLINLGNLNRMEKHLAEAEGYYREALQIAQAQGDPTVISTSYMNLGFLYNTMDRPKEAIPMFEKSLEQAKKVKSNYDIAKINNGMGMAYKKLNDNEKAKGYYLKALDEMKKMDRRETERLHLDLIPIYSSLGMQDSADYHLQKYKATLGVKVEDRVLGEAMELEKKYQTEKKEKELLLKEAEARKRNMLIIILSILVAFSLIVTYLIYRQQKLKHTQMQQEFTLKEALKEIETQNRLQRQRLEISKDLHDNIGSQLTFIISSVDNINEAYDIENPAITNRLNNISTFTRDTILELRDTIWAMNNKDISFEQLRARIFNFINKAQQAKEGVNFTFTVAESLDAKNLTSLEGMNIYRMIQEAVNNSIKHSGATTVAIDITHEGGFISISIRDNGVGFVINDTDKGNGLMNMEKRVEDIGGRFELVSAPGEGTTITAILSDKKDNA